MSQYHRFSRSAYYSVCAALPLLIAYDLLLVSVNGVNGVQVRNLGDVLLRYVLESFSIRPVHATLAMVLILILSIPLLRRGEIPLKAKYFAFMFAEALAYSLVFEDVIRPVLRFIFSAGGAFASALPGLAEGISLQMGARQGLAMSLGAGLFEEFVFRVVLLWILLTLTRLVMPSKLASLVSIVAAAFLFSAVHYFGPLGDPFTMGSFLFRFFAGLLFTGIYYLRGFAIVAYAHAFYDIRIILF